MINGKDDQYSMNLKSSVLYRAHNLNIMISSRKQTKQQTTTVTSTEVQQTKSEAQLVAPSGSSQKKKMKVTKPDIGRTLDDLEAFPFGNVDVAAELDDFLTGKRIDNSKVSLRLTMGKGRKQVTSIIGIDKDIIKDLCKTLRKEFHCGGSISEDENYGSVIDLKGDQRVAVVEYLGKHGICLAEDIVI